MNKMNKMLLLVIAAVMLLSLTGCAKIISTETEPIEVTIVDKYHKAAWYQPMHINKTTTMVYHAPVYKIYYEYNGVRDYVTGSSTYDKYKNMMGQTVDATLITETYDNGKVRVEIILR